MSITAIIQSFRRPDNIPVLIDCLRNQTVKPKRIIVWNDHVDEFGKDLHDLGKDVEIINTNTNYNGNFGAFVVAYLCDTDYIAVLDDDCPPGRRWFEFCLKHIKHGKVFAEFGITLVDNQYQGRKMVTCHVANQVSFRKVDMVGQSYFFPARAILPMLSARPPQWHNNVDLHFSFLARKYGWHLYVPTVLEEEEMASSKRIKLPLNANQNAMYKRVGHFKRRNEYVKWAIENGIIPKVK